jgi:hypothetical protein
MMLRGVSVKIGGNCEDKRRRRSVLYGGDENLGWEKI